MLYILARETLLLWLKLRTLRCEDYPGLPGRAQSNYTSPKKWKRAEERWVRKMQTEKDLMSGFEEGSRAGIWQPLEAANGSQFIWPAKKWGLWWLTSCVSVTVLRDAQIAGKFFYWVCLWSCFWTRLKFDFADLMKKIALTIVGRYQLIPWGPKQNEKVVKRHICSLCFIWDIYLLLPSDIRHPNLEFLALGPFDSDQDLHHWFYWFSIFWI